ncbi:MAG: hypothetical protein KIT84_22315 [Labilithrix sp.]|nr:hypothetical protein [Labilithrix sp.]MCW5813780.1 hypothetical protein [Labilithrix sp.]
MKLAPSLALAAALAFPRSAAASDCQVTYGFRPSQLEPCDVVSALPPNGILRLRPAGSLHGVEQLTFASEINDRFACSASESAIDCLPVLRVREGALGARFVSAELTGCLTNLIVEGDPDLEPPPAPVIAGVAIDLVEAPGRCDVDGLALRVDNVRDEATPARLLQLALYVGATEEEARTTARIEHLLEVYDAPADSVTLSVNLGRADGRERPLARGLFTAGRRCVAVETVDAGGNFSPRSAPVCFDHTNESDPHVRRVAGTATNDGCSTTNGTAGAGSAALVLMLLTLLRRRSPTR